MKNKIKNINKLLLSKFIQYRLHIGDLRFRCNPKSKPYMLGFRSEFGVVNLNKTYSNFKRALKFLNQLISSDKKILFVGGPLGVEKDFSLLCSKYGHYYVNSYASGLFTNFSKKDLDIVSVFSFENRPSLVFFFDLSKNGKIVHDVKQLNIPIMAFVGTNDKIEDIDFIIPANIQSWKGGLFVFNVLHNVMSSSTKS